MSFINYTIPSFTTVIPVDTRTNNLKVLLLPTASTNSGRLLTFKDYYGTSSNSTFTLSTTGIDLLDDINNRYTFSNAFGSMSFLSDGLRAWRTLDLYNGAYSLSASTNIGNTIQAFSYTGSDQSFTVPAGITSIGVYMWGAGGGGNTTGTGGAGAMVQGVFAVTAGQVLTLIVGQGGVITSTSTYGGGGGGGVPGNGTAGQGGGRSAVRRSAVELVTAGGGGGCGYPGNSGGKATFSGTADSGVTGPGAGGGGGGTQISGGTASTNLCGTANSAGSQFTGGKGGGEGCAAGGGGGGGWYGGGGGASRDGANGSGGGGGSSLITNLSLIPGESVFGFNSSNNVAAPNTGSIYYAAGIGAGGASGNGAGGNGRIVLRY